MPNLSTEFLAELQNLQDLLAKKTSLCLALLSRQGEEITIPSRLPNCCNNFNNFEQKKRCAAGIRRILNQASNRDEIVIEKCWQGLYVFCFKTNIQLVNKETFLLGRNTKELTVIKDEIELIKTIFQLPLCLNITLTENESSVTQNEKTSLFTDFNNLTSREIEVLRFLAMGYTNKMIASKLYISPNTVKTHVSQIITKLGVKSRTEAALVALNSNLINQSAK